MNHGDTESTGKSNLGGAGIAGPRVTRVLDGERQPGQGWRVNHYPVRLRGDKMSAVKLAREIYGLDLQRTVAFVDEIERRK